MKYLILCFLAGLLTGIVFVYIWHRTHPIGTLKLYEQDDGMISAFLELEREMNEIKQQKTVNLRVENHSYYEIN